MGARVAQWLAALALGVALAGCVTASVARAHANEYCASWNAHDVRELASAYAQDAVLTLPDGRKLEGRRAIAAYHRALFATYPDARLDVVDIDVTSDDRPDERRLHATWRFTAGGKTVTLVTESRATRDDDGEYHVVEGSWRTSTTALFASIKPSIAASPSAE